MVKVGNIITIKDGGRGRIVGVYRNKMIAVELEEFNYEETNFSFHLFKLEKVRK